MNHVTYKGAQNTESKTSDNKTEPYKGAQNTETKTADNKSEPCDIQGSTKYRIKDIR